MKTTFDYASRSEALLTSPIVQLLTAIQEAKGRQDVRADIRPDVLSSLVDAARIQSTDASNRIEGISTSGKRLASLVRNKVTPHNRDEEEIAGYRDVLAVIHDNHDYIPITPNVILQLHRDLFRHTPLTFGGRFKDGDNIIVERDMTGHQRTHFIPPSALITPELMERACDSYNEAINDKQANPMLVLCMFVFDFTCIHPFDDGNGRMSRLLTLLTLYRNGYEVGRYVSLEHLIERSKSTYYEALAASTIGWNDDANDYEPFVRYMLGVVLTAYKELDERFEGLSGAGRPTKERRIRMLIEGTLTPMSKAEVVERLSDVSVSTVERVLKRLLDDGEIIKIGAGRSTRYIMRR